MKSGTGRPEALSVGSWILYDLANTIFSLNIISLYFSLWVVGVMGGSDSDFGLANSASMAVILVVSPWLGAITDRIGRRIPFLIASTAICIITTCFLGTVGLKSALILFAVANIGYQAGVQFYDSLLPDVSTPGNRGRISGAGVSIGYIGSFIGLMAGWLILHGTENLAPALQSRKYTSLFQVTAILFGVFAVPCFIFVREKTKIPRNRGKKILSESLRRVWNTVKGLKQKPDLGKFLLGRVFYTDAVNTVIAFMGIYMVKEVGFTAGETTGVMLAAIACSIAGGLIWGPVVDKIGPKRTLEKVLLLWMVVFVVAAFVGFLHLPKWAFWPVPCLAGIAIGGTWTSDRPLMLNLAPPGRIGEYYGLYGMVGRFSMVTGPLLWSLVVDWLGLGRPSAILTLLLMVITGFLVISRVRENKGT